MFKSKSSRLASRLARQRQREADEVEEEQEREREREREQDQERQAEAARAAAALPKQDYLDNCHRTYSCIHCRAHLANHDELISKLFQGNQGRAYLFNKVVNVGCRQAITRELLTGLHAVCDIYCKTCETTLGWKYEQAFVASQKYKEGKFIIELVHMIKENNSDPSSFNRAKQLFHGAHRQQVPAYEQVYLSSECNSSSSSSSSSWDTTKQHQQPPVRRQNHIRNGTSGRDRSSSSISIYRNGPSLANTTGTTGTTRLRAPSTPAVPTCAQQREETTQSCDVIVVSALPVHTNHAENETENENNASLTGDNNEPRNQSQATHLEIANSEESRLDEMLERPLDGSAAPVILREVQSSFVDRTLNKEITHRNNHQLTSASSASALCLAAPTTGVAGGGGAAKGSSENSSQLSSSSASSNSLAIEQQDQLVAIADK